jgi:hypothetical protein
MKKINQSGAVQSTAFDPSLSILPPRSERVAAWSSPLALFMVAHDHTLS